MKQLKQSSPLRKIIQMLLLYYQRAAGRIFPAGKSFLSSPAYGIHEFAILLTASSIASRKAILVISTSLQYLIDEPHLTLFFHTIHLCEAGEGKSVS